MKKINLFNKIWCRLKPLGKEGYIKTREGFIHYEKIKTKFNCDFCDNRAKYLFYYYNAKKDYRKIFWLCKKCLKEEIRLYS